MKMKSLKNLLNIFYPNTCVCCDGQLLDQEYFVCLECRLDLPYINNNDCKENSISTVFNGRVPIVKAASFLSYTQTGKAKKIIHQLKYKGNQKIGHFIGKWFGEKLLNTGEFDTIDCIIPVPLHPKKLRQRGYNQLTTFGKSLETVLEIPYCDTVLKRVSSSKTQTLKKRLERFTNQDSKFTIENETLIQNKHVLLIDDVITTGATLEACCNELLKVAGVKISIVSIALTE